MQTLNSNNTSPFLLVLSLLIFFVGRMCVGAGTPTLDEINAGFQNASNTFLKETDAFAIQILTKKIEFLIPGEPPFQSQIRTILARSQSQWLTKIDVIDTFTIQDKGQQKRQKDPYFEVYMTKNGQVLQWTSDNSQCYIDPFLNSNIYLYWDYSRYLGINVYKTIAETNGISYAALQQESLHNPIYAMLKEPFIETFGQNVSKYRILPNKENIDDFPCWVIEWTGMDKMWIDIEHGFALRKRIIHFAPDMPIKYEVHNDDFKQVKPGLWLPYTQTVEEYANPEHRPKNLWGKPVRRIHYAIEQIAVDNIDTSIFDIAVPAGTYVMDSIRKMDFVVVEDQTDPFEDPIDMAVQKLAYYKYRAIVMIIANIVFVFILLVWLLFFRPKNKKSPKPPKLFLLLPILYLFGGYVCASAAEPAQLSEWNLAPHWRERGDCAVNSLYMLLKIEGKKVRLEKLKKFIPIDSEQGSSFNTLQQAARQFGLDTEIRFVKPNELPRLMGPYIIHGVTSIEKDIGHCLVIIDYDKNRKGFTIIDPIFGRFELKNEQVIKRGYTGYILIPRLSTPRFWNRIFGLSLIFTGVVLLILLRKHFLPTMNRTVQILLVFCLCSAVFGCTSRHDSDPPARKAARGEIIPLLINARELPIRIEPVGNPQHIVTEKQLAVALAASLPLWHPPVAKRSFKTVLPCSHAAKALTLLIHQESFEVWQRLNQSEHARIRSERRTEKFNAK